MQPTQQDYQRLRWQCRRGMLELDLMLENYLQARYPDMSDVQKADFARFLKNPDQLLYDWLMEQQIPTDKKVAQLVADIRLNT
ncbi:MAG: succinate dehydrogenase assembly factor 2 [gamma proteobacterium symbiont of Bathyaustriella thionipta]|nr:succinate dehydrogenase assembly factor 2 [gamma proteobacterium symbiont of Bathyaustriella thionipta]